MGSGKEEQEGAGGLTRRQTLGLAGVAGAGLVAAGLGGVLPGTGGSDEAIARAAKTCLRLTPEQDQGPYYVDLGRVRGDIVEDQPGVPLALRIRIVDHVRCVPVANAAVDLSQCNAFGLYSDKRGQGTLGEEFLRGIQFTDTDGFARFRTIYPGHYRKRATHVHLKVHIGGRHTKTRYSGGHVCHTGQLLFRESFTDEVYALAPYSRSKVPRTPNSRDAVYLHQGGSKCVLRLSGDPKRGIDGTIALGVDPKATPPLIESD
jgi:protocatechuate 3,4-dioxygenase beta subunit